MDSHDRIPISEVNYEAKYTKTGKRGEIGTLWQGQEKWFHQNKEMLGYNYNSLTEAFNSKPEVQAENDNTSWDWTKKKMKNLETTRLLQIL